MLCLLLTLFGMVILSGCNKTYPPTLIPDHIIPLTEDTLNETIKTSPGYLLVHFTSYDPDCGYCIPSNPYIDELTQNYTISLKVARMHWEPWTDHTYRTPAIKKQFNIKGIPLLILYKDGRETWRGFGYTDETHKKLEAQLENCCQIP